MSRLVRTAKRIKAYTRDTRGVPRPSEVSLRRFDVAALDIVSGFPTTKTGFDAIVVFTDRLTKRVHIEPCTKTASARDLALIFFRTVFRLVFSCPTTARNLPLNFGQNFFLSSKQTFD